MRTGLAERLRDGVLLLDGGMGTALMARGLAAGASTAEWNLEHPDEVPAAASGQEFPRAQRQHVLAVGDEPEHGEDASLGVMATREAHLGGSERQYVLRELPLQELA